MHGYLEPCGCTSRPLGGVDKLAARLRKVARDGVPQVLVGAGDLLFGEKHGAEGGAAAGRPLDQELWKAETLVDVLSRLHMRAATPGDLDVAYGAQTFASLARASRFPWLAAGDRIAGASLRETVVERVGGVRVGIFGVSELEAPDGSLPAGVTRGARAVAAAERAARALREQEVDVVVALVHGSRRTARRVAAAAPEIDFVVEGGLAQANVSPPSSAGRAILLQAGREGHGVLVVDVFLGDVDPDERASWTDASEWTRSAERTRVEQRIADLRARIAEWERDPGVDRASLAGQRTRLRAMEQEQRALTRRVRLGSGPTIVARWEPLEEDAPEDPEIGALMDRYDRRVNDHNRRIFADLAPPPALPGRATYEGAEECGTCHEEAFTWWRGHEHGKAYATLVERHKEFNLSCVGCHVTGYNQPSGSTVTHNEGLVDVGCESCHGPGSLHAAAPRQRGLIARVVPENTCVGCHNSEHSDLFDYPSYRADLMKPGHGRPMPDGRLVAGQRPEDFPDAGTGTRSR